MNLPITKKNTFLIKWVLFQELKNDNIKNLLKELRPSVEKIRVSDSGFDLGT